MPTHVMECMRAPSRDAAFPVSAADAAARVAAREPVAHAARALWFARAAERARHPVPGPDRTLGVDGRL